MNANSINCKSISELKEVLENFNFFVPTLAMCFASSSFSVEEIQEVFSANNISLIGSSSAGEISDDCIESQSMSVMLFDLPKDCFKIITKDFSVDEFYQTAFSIGKDAVEKFSDPALIVLCSKYGLDGQSVINGLKDGLNKKSPIFGGLAANDVGENDVWVCGNNIKYEEGMAVLVLDHSKIQVTGLATSGWEPIGVTHTITKSNGNEIAKINNEPALDVFINYFGFFEDANSTNITDAKTISGQYPFQIEKHSGDHVLRSPIMANLKERSLIMGGSVIEGQKFKFSSSPGFHVIEQSINEFKQFAQAEANEADALLLFSCIGRHASFGPMLENEMEGIVNIWNAPMTGAFTLGEIGKVRNGDCEFHNITSSLVVLKQR